MPPRTPREPVYEIVRRDRNSYPVYAVQKYLNKAIGANLETDGVCGRWTTKAVRRYQKESNLFVDGNFGPVTSRYALDELCEVATEGVPEYLLFSLAFGESDGHIGNVNWSTAGGVDCSWFQRRILTKDFGTYVEAAAWDPITQAEIARDDIIYKYGTFRSRPAVTTNERAWRLAVLHHNWQWAADKLSYTPESDLTPSYWRAPSAPTEFPARVGATFTDGTPVRTPLEWCQFYSLGNAQYNHSGKMTKFVESWVPINRR